MGTKPAALDETATTRLSDLATHLRDARETVDVSRRKLQTEILAAIDVHGASTSEVARIIGVSPTRVYGIIAAAYRDAS